jgi:type I restriction enzyme S subunit
MSELKKYKLGDLGFFFGGVTTIGKEDYGHGTPFLPYKNVYKNSKVNVNELELMNIRPQDIERRSAKYGDIFFTASSETPDEVAMSSVLLDDVENLTYNGFCKRYRLNDFNTLLPEYARYLFRDINFRREVYQVATGDIRFNISQESLAKIVIEIPDVATQAQLAEILMKLDDKIELNLQMNQTLEAMAQALFKDWFVNFNFPNFDGELENGLPKGWRMGKLGDICSNVRVSFNPNRDGFTTNYIGLEHIPRRSIMLLDWGNSEDINSQKSQFVRGDILFGKLRPYFHKVIIAPFDGICSTDILVIRALENKFHLYSYFQLFSDECIKYSNSQSDGTRMPRVNWNSLSNYEIPIPSMDILDLFQQTISPIFEKVYLSIFENQSLTQTRDSLLPKLMSGKLEIKK